MTDVNLIGGFYKSKSLPFSAQDLVNWLPVPSKTDQSRSPIKLRGLPGLSSLTVSAVDPVRITNLAPDGEVGVAYSFTYTASGGTPPYTFSLASGLVPAGLTFSAGVISGTPTTPQISDIVPRVTDSEGQTDERPDRITIIEPPLAGNWIVFGQRPAPNLERFAISTASITTVDFAARESTGSSSTAVVAGVNGNYVVAALTSLNSVLVSSNRGDTWDEYSTASGFGTDISSPVWVDGTIVLGRSNTSVQRSVNDGVNWSNSGTFGGRFMATDGTTIVAFAAASNQCAVSTNAGASFSLSGTIPGPTRTVVSIAYLSGVWVALLSDVAGLYRSRSLDSGATWSTPASLPFTTPTATMAFGGEQVMAGGTRFVIPAQDGEVVYSTDGGNTFTLGGATGLSVITACWFGDGLFVVSGQRNVMGTPTTTIATSSNGISWALSTLNNLPAAASVEALVYVPA